MTTYNLTRRISRACKALISNSVLEKNVDAISFPEVDVFYWSPASGQRNFGDHLAKIIVTKILADRGHVIEEEVPRPCRLFSVGSVLHFAREGDVIWGSGVNGKVMHHKSHNYKNLDVRAVRGPLSRQFLLNKGIDVPEIFGDPALLMPLIFPGRFIKKTMRKLAVVPNLHDLHQVASSHAEDLVSPLSSWNSCIQKILEAELVVSSSLHGIILAEAYGVPARYVRLSDTEPPFKYDDYMQGTGRHRMEAARSVAEAIAMGGMPPPIFDARNLLNAFPMDLWERT